MSSSDNSDKDDLVLRVYNLSIQPAGLLEMIRVWDRAQSGPDADLEVFSQHLGAASKIMDHLGTSQADAARSNSDRPEDKAVICQSGAFVEGASAFAQGGPAPATLWDIVPESHHKEIRQSLDQLGREDKDAARLIVCQNGSNRDRLLLVLQKQNAASPGQRPQFRISMLRSVWTGRLRQYFLDQYKLSNSELSLLHLMVEGHGFRDIEKMLGKSRDTIKSQSKSVYSKLDVSGREDAVRLALQVLFLMPGAPRAAPASASSEQTSDVVRVAGQRIGVVRKGDPNGTAFLFLHGILTGYELGPDFEACLAASGLCMICPERPGYGASDNPTSMKTILDEWLALFPELLSVLGLKQSSLLTHASGAAYVAATMDRYPQLAPRGLGLSIGIPGRSGRSNEGLPPFHRFVYWCLSNAPSSFDFVYKAFVAYRSHGNSLEDIIRDNYSQSEPDRLSLKSDAVLDCLKSGYLLFEREKHMGVIGDVLTLWGQPERWRDIVDRQTQGAHLHHLWGEQDPFIPFEEARAYCDRHAFTSWSRLKGAGHLMQFTHASQIVRRIRLMVDDHPDWARA